MASKKEIKKTKTNEWKQIAIIIFAVVFTFCLFLIGISNIGNGGAAFAAFIGRNAIVFFGILIFVYIVFEICLIQDYNNIAASNEKGYLNFVGYNITLLSVLALIEVIIFSLIDVFVNKIDVVISSVKESVSALINLLVIVMQVVVFIITNIGTPGVLIILAIIVYLGIKYVLYVKYIKRIR